MGWITTSDFKITFENFWITERQIQDKLKEEKLNNTQLSENRIIVWLIIKRIREKINKQFENNFEWKVSKEIINLLNEPLKINEKINEEINEIRILIIRILNLDFSSIDEQFLSNETRVSNFIKSSEFFLKS